LPSTIRRNIADSKKNIFEFFHFEFQTLRRTAVTCGIHPTSFQPDDPIFREFLAVWPLSGWSALSLFRSPTVPSCTFFSSLALESHVGHA
jgi:hypothetical protein